MESLSIDARKALAARHAVPYGLDQALVCALADYESEGWNPWAIRYEPAFFSEYIQPMLNEGKLTSITEATARAVSWGLCQVMGETARELGFSGHLASLCDPDTGLEYGCLKLKQCMDEASGDVRAALLKYNGGRDAAYPDLVLDLLAKYTGATQ